MASGKTTAKGGRKSAPLSDALEIVRGHPIHLEHRIAPALSVAAVLNVPVKRGDATTIVTIYVGLSPWGLIDHMRGAESPASASQDADDLVRSIAERLEIV